VTDGHTVTLTGGDLHLSGVTFALGQEFDDIMTFQPGALTGTFATVQGGGNGRFVDIGNGLRLNVIYDNAGGDISIEVGRSGKIWNDATGSAPGAPIATDDVEIGLTTTGNVTLNNTTTVNSLLIDASNALTIASGTTLTVSTTVANSGSLTLQGSTLTAASFANAGITSGFGTIVPLIANTGLVRADGGTLTAQGGIQGAGNITVNPAATLDLSKATAGSTVGTLAQNGNLNLGANNITVSSDYTNANFGTGNNFNKVANVTRTTGQILAAGPNPDNMQVVTGTKVTGGNSATPTLALGIVHVNDSTTYQIANQGTPANPSLRGAIQPMTSSLLSGTGVTPGNFGPIAPGTSTTDFTVTAAAPGILSNEKVHFANNFGNVHEQDMSITGQINNYAALALLKEGGDGTLSDSFFLDFGDVALGSPTEEALLAILNDNLLAEQAFTDLLTTNADDSMGPFRLTGCSVKDLPGGEKHSGCDVFFDTSNPGDFLFSFLFPVESSNDSGYDQFRDPVTLTIHGTVIGTQPVPEPSTMTILASGLGTLFFIVRRRRRTG
jgi:hypothetical protein